MSWLLQKVVDGAICYWAFYQVALTIRTYRDINSLEELGSGN